MLGLMLLCRALAAGGGPQKPIMVHYMPWFESAPVSGHWGWHWTMNHFHPDIVNPTNGQRQIASRYYPLIGPYDSIDPAVLEYHVLLMKLAGIDGAIVDWYGMDAFNDYAVNNARTLALFNYTRKAGLKFALCYEDATIQQEVRGGFVTAEGALVHARQTLLYAQSNFFDDPSYLRWKARPVLLDFGPQYFRGDHDWASVFSILQGTNQPAFFTENNRLAPTGAGAFDWPPMFLSKARTSPQAVSVLGDQTLHRYLEDFTRKAGAWPAFVSSAFPRFEDIYAQAGVQQSFGSLADEGGETFRNTVSTALTNGSSCVQLVTWNDFGEGTVIEPTVEFGYRDLAVVQELRRRHLEAAFPFAKDDLTLPLRLYRLRKKLDASNEALSSKLDHIFHSIIAGELSSARIELAELETQGAVIDVASVTHGPNGFATEPNHDVK
jgi:hypothetical protein